MIMRTKIRRIVYSSSGSKVRQAKELDDEQYWAPGSTYWDF